MAITAYSLSAVSHLEATRNGVRLVASAGSGTGASAVTVFDAQGPNEAIVVAVSAQWRSVSPAAAARLRKTKLARAASLAVSDIASARLTSASAGDPPRHAH